MTKFLMISLMISAVVMVPVSFCLAEEDAGLLADETLSGASLEDQQAFLEGADEETLTDSLMTEDPSEEGNLDPEGNVDPFSLGKFIALGKGGPTEKIISPEEAVRLLVDNPQDADKYAKYLSSPVPDLASGANHYTREKYWGDNWIQAKDANGNFTGSYIAPIVEAPAFTPESLGITPQSLGITPEAGAERPSYAGADWVQTTNGSYIAPPCPNNSC